MALFGLFRRRPHERRGFELYGAAVRAARQPYFFAELGVPDTLDGRFDLVGLHVALLIRRLHRDADPRGAALAQAVFDAMFADMDTNLREMGVGDMSIAKRVKNMWEAFHGRAQAYEAPLTAGDRAGLAEALARNVWRGSREAGDAAARRLADLAFAADDALAGQPLERLLKGQAHFPEVVA
ncbi:ubiquinol-cytochrome C chaperone family protein [Roseomonas marmotae]|uniref:Ubiquinol-cytochrome C chaperone n=1 Tax=Roseomonas marmotae TaxID=2768161 RepID=A0ABS3KA72_9PROT|nr:ubiquinol-cytochrome C chaperone family protein [Roseomonas marmotae]MBO1074340.1 ubiquinol-cytochrome C chaperone [Roseomonas marmotae]QTI78091.1 ubiquinol-cytochrome C chaperone [Roseomonas marmotae]